MKVSSYLKPSMEKNKTKLRSKPKSEAKTIKLLGENIRGKTS